MSTTYFIRVDVHTDYENGISKLEQFCSKVLGVYHTGKNNDNPHWHFAVTTDARSVPALRARVRKFWTVPKSISIKEWNLGERKVLVYMFHEKEKDSFKVVSQKGYDDEEVKSFKEESVNKKKGDESRRKREPTFTEKLVDKAVEEFGTEYNGDDKVVVKWVMKQFGAHKKVWDEYVIYKAYNLVSQHIRGDAFLETAIYKLNTVAMRNCQDLLLCHK